MHRSCVACRCIPPASKIIALHQPSATVVACGHAQHGRKGMEFRTPALATYNIMDKSMTGCTTRMMPFDRLDGLLRLGLCKCCHFYDGRMMMSRSKSQDDDSMMMSLPTHTTHTVIYCQCVSVVVEERACQPVLKSVHELAMKYDCPTRSHTHTHTHDVNDVSVQITR
jgi:hypothetical protein